MMEPQRAAQSFDPGASSGVFEVPVDGGFTQAPGPVPEVTSIGNGPGGGGALSASELAFGDAPRGVTTGRPTVRTGSNGPSVLDLQSRLDQLGEALAVDGMFGPLTRAAVVRFQTARGLDPDGIVGPKTWAALDAATPRRDPETDTDADPDIDPVLGDLGGDGDNVAIGDAEGNLDEPASSTTGGLETLDRDGSDTTQGPLTPAGSLFGFKDKAAGPAAPVTHAKKPGLIAGEFADRGQYKATGDGFVDAELDELLAAYGTFWGVDVRAVARPDDGIQTGAGDSAGKGVTAHPPWVKAMTNKIMGHAKWTDDDRATQRLIEAFLRRFARDAGGELPPGAEQLFHDVGASETNGQANALGGFKGASNWCAQASHFGLILGMYNRGIRFKTDTHSHKYGVEITKQVAQYSKWTKQAGHVVSGAAANTAQLEPGDIISVVNGGTSGPLSGHVATVVQHTGDQIVYVSGNAAGVVAFEGGVRIEEVVREQPPAGYDWLAMSKREQQFVGAKQTEKTSRDAAAGKRAEMAAHLAFITERVDTPIPFFVDLNNPASVAALIVFLNGRPETPEKAALIGNAVEIQKLQAEALGADAITVGAQATEQAMMSDGGLPVNRDDPRFVPGTHAPKDATHSWVVEVIKASALTAAQVLADGTTSVEPSDPMLEKGPRLGEQCPDAPPEVINQSAR